MKYINDLKNQYLSQAEARQVSFTQNTRSSQPDKKMAGHTAGATYKKLLPRGKFARRMFSDKS
ncbi:hypothetical protein CI610_00831 [invertebrate metagenome]|uniref:Uncharacterized protein n=1 Tax=invertebrate metagenome TaxID=1711999 RepID=A0A2H9TAG5_9ZZZZ